LIRPRVFLADGHLEFLEAEIALLQPHFELVGTAHDGVSLVSEVQRLNPETRRSESQELARRTAAILASLTSSCRRHEMDPQLYFMQLLMNLPSWPVNDIDAWLPDRWKQAHADRCAVLEIPPLDS
jgi:hypothetical protein